MQPRTFHPGPLSGGDELVLGDAAARHLRTVLRLQRGARLVLFNGDGREYPAELLTTGKPLRVRLDAARPGLADSPLAPVLMQGICRGARMDLVIQKATELGVAAILPLACERSVVRLDGPRAEARRQHWQGVARAAAEQCGRASVPRIGAAATLADGIAALPAAGSRLLLSPGAGTGIGAALRQWPPLVILCGPEGGFSDGERALAAGAGFTPVSLGPRVLRTETAPLVALAILQYLYGDLREGG
ncbi:MAG: 16S rRNA (uracil(1498)-N(3))-methyltransferase [Gammaproteobacteria bacterium]|nr:MAG: 16S rRNA (uracil(1498)-N(3))-methyltransferase [Gammaproteobacteria bacterium]